MNFVVTILLIATGFSDPHIPNGERVVYLGYDGGNNTSREIAHVIYDKGDQYYSIHQHLDTTKIIVKCWIRKQDLATNKVIKDRSGRFQLGIEPLPDGILVKDGFKAKESKVSYSGGAFYDRHSLIEVFRGFPFQTPQTIEFPFFESNLGTVITGTCVYGGKHDIETEIGTLCCHKLTLGFKSKLIDTAYRVFLAGRSFDFYYDVDPPHRLVYWTDNKEGYMKLLRIESEGE